MDWDKPLIYADWRDADSRRSATICEPKAARISGESMNWDKPLIRAD